MQTGLFEDYDAVCLRVATNIRGCLADLAGLEGHDERTSVLLPMIAKLLPKMRHSKHYDAICHDVRLALAGIARQGRQVFISVAAEAGLPVPDIMDLLGDLD